MAHSHKRLVASAVMLILSLTGGPLLAGQGVGTIASTHIIRSSQSLQGSRTDDVRAAPPSRINGRLDWDTDYPSQLAPEALDLPQARDVAATATAPACAEVESYVR